MAEAAARRVSLGIIVAALVVFAAQAVLYWPFTVDDTFITLRYSRHLAAGYGLAWNPGGPPIEGYTSPIWVLLMALPHAVGVDAELTAKALGVVATLGTAGVVWLLARRLLRLAGAEGYRWLPATGPAIYLCVPAVTLHAVSGMETGLFILAVVVFVDRAVAYVVDAGGRRARAVAVAGLFMGLVRPEGNLVVLVALALILCLGQKHVRQPLLRSAVLWYLAPGAAYFAARWAYFGEPLPLPFYVKSSSHTAFAGVSTVVDFARYLGSHLGLLIVPGLFALPRKAWLPIAGALSLLVYFTYPAHLMGFEWRFLVPVLPVLVAVAVVGMAVILRGGESLAKGTTGVSLALASAVLALVCGGFLLGARSAKRTATDYRRAEQIAIDYGRELARVGEGRIAIGDAGAVPYFSGWEVIDLFGLSEPALARSLDLPPEYVLDQQPDLVVLMSESAEVFEGRLPLERRLLPACQERGWKRLRTVEVIAGSYYWWVFANPASDLLQRLDPP